MINDSHWIDWTKKIDFVIFLREISAANFILEGRRSRNFLLFSLRKPSIWDVLVKKIWIYQNNVVKNHGQGRRQLREIGGGGEIKIRGAKLFHYSWIGLRRSFSKNQVISKKKGLRQSFSGQNQMIPPPPPKKGLRRNRKAFSGRNHKFKRFFRPKPTTFSSPKIPWGARNKSGGKNENRGGIAPPAPPLATLPDQRVCFEIDCRETPKQLRFCLIYSATVVSWQQDKAKISY